jgi:hypothetical protein
MRLAVRLCPTALPGVKQLDQVPTFRIFRGANLVSSRRRRRVIALIRTYLLVASVALSHAAISRFDVLQLHRFGCEIEDSLRTTCPREWWNGGVQHQLHQGRSREEVMYGHFWVSVR